MRKHLPPLLFILAAVLFCVYLVLSGSGLGGVGATVLFYLPFFIAFAALVLLTVFRHAEGPGTVSLGFVLMLEGFLGLFILVNLLRDLLF